ncbi:MAG: type II toxin-antitoxin system RelE/ParE family toxin [Bacteroidota bacterium]
MKAAYRIAIQKKALKTLAEIPEPYYGKIKAAILALAFNPRPPGYKKLKGRRGYRVRVAHYRIIYEVFGRILLIEVIAIGHRKDIYA